MKDEEDEENGGSGKRHMGDRQDEGKAAVVVDASDRIQLIPVHGTRFPPFSPRIVGILASPARR